MNIQTADLRRARGQARRRRPHVRQLRRPPVLRWTDRHAEDLRGQLLRPQGTGRPGNGRVLVIDGGA